MKQWLTFENMLWLNGLIVGAFVFFIIRNLRYREKTYFKDDLWCDEEVVPGSSQDQIRKMVDRVAIDGHGPEGIKRLTDGIPAASARQNQQKSVQDETDQTNPWSQANSKTKKQSQPRRPPKQHIRAPKFTGAPHEVLVVEPEASAQDIMKAFRFWVKRYHPDRVEHLGQQYVDQAKRRTEQLNAARSVMLARLGKKSY